MKLAIYMILELICFPGAEETTSINKYKVFNSKSLNKHMFENGGDE